MIDYIDREIIKYIYEYPKRGLVRFADDLSRALGVTIDIPLIALDKLIENGHIMRKETFYRKSIHSVIENKKTLTIIA